MSSILALLIAPAFAGTAVWLDGTPDASATPGDVTLTAEDAAPSQGWTEADNRRLAFLDEELRSVRPLADVFDGELQIMRRLESATADIEALRQQDRRLLYAALVFQGFAVRRYFQDGLATDPAAEPYRVQVGDKVEVKAWVDAVALDPDHVPDNADIPEEPELVAFQELRARHLLAPVSTIEAPSLPPGGRLVVDGRAVPADRARVPPGAHRVAVQVGDEILARSFTRTEPATSVSIEPPASADDLRAIAPLLRAGAPAVGLSEPVQVTLSRLTPPVRIVAEGRKGPEVYEVQGDKAVRDEEPDTTSSSGEAGLILHAAVAGGWVNDGEFFLQNITRGAPYTRGTVNAAALTLTAEATWAFTPWLAVGGGVDGQRTIGEDHDLPIGDQLVALRLYPHVSVGHPWAQLTAGLALPWRFGIGPRVAIPVGPFLEISGAYTYGVGVTRPRDGGAPDFEPLDASTAWLGVGGRFSTGR